ncbi:MAG: hypothetical protein MRQ13_02560 [Candidatus Midichloria sp.]|nr:hypothetical protein [Candidatus Midichloria sp.]
MAQSVFNLASLNGKNGFAIDGINPSDYAGQSVASAGYIKMAIVNDIIIGAPGIILRSMQDKRI